MSTPTELQKLPKDLPRPVDDGAADHLTGMRLPNLALLATSEERVNLSQRTGRTVVYAYPMTGVPGVALPEGWDDIPGARGCTVEALAFKDHGAAIAELGADVFGLSTQETLYQQEMVDRLHLPFPVLSDAQLELTQALRLPTMTVEGKTLLKRLTIIVSNGAIEHIFYPVFPPDHAAFTVLAWLEQHKR